MTLQEALGSIKDERIERCKKHNLVDILMIVFIGILCGYKSIEQIQFYAELSEDMNCPHKLGHLLEVYYMVKRKKYSIDFKLQVVGKYERGTCGYKKLARAYGLSRDTVRSWCLNPRLREITTMARKKNINNEENDIEYYKTAALFWETYAKNVEAELAKQGKKNSF